MRLLSTTSFLCCLLLTISPVTSAAPYIGFGVGSADYKVDLGPAIGRSYDDTATTTKIFAGYRVNKYVAGEVIYYNFAEASVSALETSPGSGNFVSAKASADGLAFYVVGIYPVSKQFSLSAKAGMLNWNADLSVNNASGSNDGSDLAYGLAAKYSFTKQVGVFAEWENFETDNPELSLLSVGFTFVFD